MSETQHNKPKVPDMPGLYPNNDDLPVDNSISSVDNCSLPYRQLKNLRLAIHADVLATKCFRFRRSVCGGYSVIDHPRRIRAGRRR